jgi:DNA-directed RNA polymerase subunit alpha
VSKTIHTPQLASIDEHSSTSATFVIEPLHSGYGMTLGNSIRRVLLSSIAGAAVTAFKVEGATHEFTTINGVKEDVVDIMLQLKGLRFKVYSEEPQTLRITKKGRGPVTGADIKGNANVEVINTDHVICTIDDEKASVTMDIVVEVGRGYRSIEETTLTKNSDMIAVDALFSPVMRVRYKVEDTRVGQITDLDKLAVTVETDGTITPNDAFEQAAAILLNQYTALAGSTRIAMAAPLQREVRETASEAEPAVVGAPAIGELSAPIEELNLSARTTNALINNEIHTLKDLFSLSDAELRDLKGFGSKALDEVREKMAEMEL